MDSVTPVKQTLGGEALEVCRKHALRYTGQYFGWQGGELWTLMVTIIHALSVPRSLFLALLQEEGLVSFLELSLVRSTLILSWA